MPCSTAAVPLGEDGLPDPSPDRELALLSRDHGYAPTDIARLTGWSPRFVRERLRAWRFATLLRDLATDPMLSPEERAERAWTLSRAVPAPGARTPLPHAARPMLRAATKPDPRGRPLHPLHVGMVADRLRGQAVDVIARRRGVNIATVVRVLAKARDRLDPRHGHRSALRLPGAPPSLAEDDS